MVHKTKICPNCGELPLSAFGIDKSRKDGFNNKCKFCQNSRNKKYRERNKDKIAVYKDKNRDRKNTYNRKYYRENKKKAKIYAAEYRQTHKDEARIYNLEHKEELNKNRRQRYKNDIKFRIRNLIGASIWRYLKRKENGQRLELIVGYTIDDLIKRLKSTLPDGYTWKDYINGSDLHIDHIIPIAAHNFKSVKDTDFKRCWALKNLRLLTAKENISKKDKLKQPFQPSLLGL